MKELQLVIAAYRQARARGLQASLATVVAISGSAYRRPGARMLVFEDGSTIGSVSGGCLERSVIEQCLLSIQSGKFMLLSYDTSHDDDIILGSGSGCPGTVLVFIEKLADEFESKQLRNPLLIVHELIGSSDVFCPAAQKQSACGLSDQSQPSHPVNELRDFGLASVVRADGTLSDLLGAKFIIEKRLDSAPIEQASGLASWKFVILDELGQYRLSASIINRDLISSAFLSGQNRNIIFHVAVSQDIAAVFATKKPRLRSYDLCGSKLDLFLELIVPAPRLLIFGAGHDAPALAALAHSVGMRVHVFDHRKAYADPARFPSAECVTHFKPEDLSSLPPFSQDCFGVVMAHNFLVDKVVLARLLQSPIRYVGALGPQLRTDRILQELRQEGIDLSRCQLSKVHAPVGLDIGAETPEQVALSIVAEIQAVLNRRQSGFLRDRLLPIHDPTSQINTRTLLPEKNGDSFDAENGTPQDLQNRKTRTKDASANFVQKEIRCQQSP